MDAIKKRLQEIDGSDVLDVAAGRGGSTAEIAKLLKSYDSLIGVDYVPASLAEARGNSENGACFAVMDAARLAFADSSFDTVTIVNSLHHLRDVDGTLADMYRVTRPGGRLIFFEMIRDDPDERQLTHILMHHWWAAIDSRAGISHNETLSRREILGIAGRLRLTEVEVFEQHEAPEDPFDPKLLGDLSKIIDEYPDKIKDHPDHDFLAEEGARIRARLHKVGLAWATGLVVMGIKRN